MSDTESRVLEEMFSLIEKDASDRRTDAAYGGEWGDRGARTLRDQVRFYKMGQIGTFPKEWEAYRKEAEERLDPEYDEYQRLQRKFR